jgi:hypothetical protein
MQMHVGLDFMVATVQLLGRRSWVVTSVKLCLYLSRGGNCLCIMYSLGSKFKVKAMAIFNGG